MGHAAAFDVRDARGLTARAVSRRTALRAFAAAALAGAALPRLARADGADGYLTVAGVAGVDEGAAFSSLEEALGAVRAAEPSSCVTISVHGTVWCAPATFELTAGADGGVAALVGTDAASCIAVGPDGTGARLALTNPVGSLVVRGVAFAGDVCLQGRDDVAVDACSFDRGVSCSAGGALYVAGSSFVAGGAGVAFGADMPGTRGTLVFTGNRVAGFRTALVIRCEGPQEALPVQVTCNEFDLAACDDAGNHVRTAVLCLAGGPWPAMSVAHDGNNVRSADVLLLLDGSFSAAVRWDDGALVESVADATLRADTVLSLFELTETDVETLPAGIAAVAVDEAYAGTPVADEVAWASQVMLPAPDVAPGDAGSTATLRYDANGATAGTAPEGTSVAAGTAVTVSNMGSLVNAGCIFEGWNTVPDGTGDFYAAGQVFSLVQDTVLYAQWVPAGTVATMSVPQPAEAGA